jgi:hypothetical protein
MLTINKITRYSKQNAWDHSFPENVTELDNRSHHAKFLAMLLP